MRSEPCLTVHTFRRTGGARCQLLARPPPCVRWRLRAAHCALEDETPTTSDGRRISSHCVGVLWPACDCLFVAADSHLAPAAAEVDSPSSSCLAVLPHLRRRQAVLVRFKVEMQRLHDCINRVLPCASVVVSAGEEQRFRREKRNTSTRVTFWL
jgi:hypothetical protein